MKNQFNYLKKYILADKTLLLFFCIFLFSRLFNLILLPIFNDEAIYLDWGWRETHIPGELYFSLYDNKQPLLMWIFGIAEQFFDDPLFAGRSVSIVTGICTFLGIYRISKTFFNKNVAFIATFLYTIVPIFVFYDRQALMESVIAAIGVWTCYFALRYWSTNAQKYSYIIGFFLGVGFFIKSSALIFILSFLIISCFLVLKSREKKEKAIDICIVVGIMLATDFLLLINPQFWSTLSKNTLYSLSLSEILKIPISLWINNSIGNLEIIFIFVTPFIFLFSIVGIHSVFKKGFIYKFFVLWFLLPICIETIMTRSVSIRYLVSFLPLLTIFAGVFAVEIIKKFTFGRFFLLLSIVIPLMLTFQLLFSPAYFIISLSKVTKYSLMEYIKGYTSGYGVKETVEYINKISKGKQTLVGIALNAGNPESALMAYLAKSKHITVMYLDGKLLGEPVEDKQCLSLPVQTLFVSRNNELAGLNSFLIPLKKIHNPYSDNYITISQVNQHCRGKTLKLHINQL